ncbi:MULE domain-containing protein [Aphis craccivora]|uniref:MULE domain-containing protein n=1 Tax=Aphis craccivora TaxID=307492 RepID=A0A6G0YBC5_APHCR|nr:MULE domain-containing protein [Aphis craccivora]
MQELQIEARMFDDYPFSPHGRLSVIVCWDTWIKRLNYGNSRRPILYERIIRFKDGTTLSMQHMVLGTNHVLIWKFIRFLKQEQVLQEDRLKICLSRESSTSQCKKFLMISAIF